MLRVSRTACPPRASRPTARAMSRASGRLSSSADRARYASARYSRTWRPYCGVQAHEYPGNLESLTAEQAGLLRRGHQGGELGPRVDAKLGVSVRQVRLDRVHAHVQAAGDLLVGQSERGKLDDPAFAGREGIVARAPSADPAELGRRLCGPAWAAERVELALRQRQRLPGRPSLARRALLLAEHEQGASPLETQSEPRVPGRGLGELLRRLAGRQVEHGRAPLDRRAGPRMLLLRGERAEPSGYRAGTVRLAAPHERLDQVAGYGKGARLIDMLALGVLPYGAQQADCLVWVIVEQRRDPRGARGLEPVPAEARRLRTLPHHSRVPRRFGRNPRYGGEQGTHPGTHGAHVGQS